MMVWILGESPGDRLGEIVMVDPYGFALANGAAFVLLLLACWKGFQFERDPDQPLRKGHTLAFATILL